MKNYILNKIALKKGDSLDIVESSTLPLNERLMYGTPFDLSSKTLKIEIKKESEISLHSC